MGCPECHSENPEVALYCYRCGHGLRKTDSSKHGRNNSYVVQSSEGVRQMALISTIMPQTNREEADAFRWALLLGGGVVLVLALFGLLPLAVIAGAALVPVVYLVYIYDVNAWEDAPLPVVLALFVGTGILAILISLLFFRWVFDDLYLQLVVNRNGIAGVSIPALLMFAVLLPLVAEIAKNVGMAYLAARPEFDDMIDGLTFGIAAGTAYAAFETIIAFLPVLTANELRTTDGLASWLVVILNLMIVKSLIYGTASGLAGAAYSGKGEGYDGFTPHYFATFGFAVVVNVAYWLGVRLLAYLPFGQALGLLWGLLIAGGLILKIRGTLQEALLEAAVEDAADGRRGKGATTEAAWCPECEMQLLPDALFCITCGESVRATSNVARHHIRDAADAGGAA